MTECRINLKPRSHKGRAHIYYSFTFGILSAGITGTVWTYIDYGRGYLYMGVNYMMVPWPLSDMDESKIHLDKALEISQNPLGIIILSALWGLKEKDYTLAEKELNFVINNPCTDGSELDYCGFLKSEAKRGLAIIQKKR